MPKVQYTMSDLAFKLGLGKIDAIEITDVEGRPVLRIHHDDQVQYQTVKVSIPKPRKQTARKVKERQDPVPKPRFLNPIIDASRFCREFPVSSWMR